MIQLDFRSRSGTKHPTPTSSVVRNPNPSPYSGSGSETLGIAQPFFLLHRADTFRVGKMFVTCISFGGWKKDCNLLLYLTVF